MDNPAQHVDPTRGVLPIPTQLFAAPMLRDKIKPNGSTDKGNA